MNKSIFTAIVILILTIIWIGSGFIANDQSGDKNDTSQSQKTATKELMKVTVQTVVAENYTKHVSLNGRSSASKNVVLKAEAEGQVTEILLNEGEPVKVGDKILMIDVRERKERLREAQELVKQYKIEFDAAKKLLKQGYTSDVKMAQAQSAYEAAKASLKRAEIDLEKTIVVAPFDGFLGARHVDVGDYLSVGNPMTDIVDLDPLEINLSVNEKEVVQITKGAIAKIKFINGTEKQGVVTFISPTSNDESRTFPIKIEIPNTDYTLPAGLTASVDIEIQNKQAFKIPSSALTLDDAGAVGVKIVTNENIVKFVPITIIEDKSNYIWAIGLENQSRLVTVGQDFIVPQQKVEAIEMVKK